MQDIDEKNHKTKINHGNLNWIKNIKSYINTTNEPSFIVNTPGCKITDFNPFNDDVLPHFKAMEQMVCNDGAGPLVVLDKGNLYVDMDVAGVCKYSIARIIHSTNTRKIRTN